MNADEDKTESLHDQFVLKLLAHRHQLLAFIGKQLVNANDVEDVFQKTSLVLWKKMDQYDPEQSFLSWAFGVAFNEVRNHLRTKSRDRLQFSPELIQLLAQEAQGEDQLSLARNEALKRCLGQLSENNETLVRQCYLDRTSITHVADEVGINRGALYKKLARIKEKLLECIRQRLAVEGGLV